MKIGSGIQSFYNSTSKVNDLSQVSGASRVSDQASGLSERNSQDNGGSGYIAEHGGVIRTKVSPENAFQKVRLENPRQRVEDMADKLMSKLPDIMKDMKRLTEDDAAERQKVVINENNAAAARKAATGEAQLADFTL